jgi:hypothetical protein
MILQAEEDLLPAVAALGDVVRDVGNDDAREPGHQPASRGGDGASIDYGDFGLKYPVPGLAAPMPDDPCGILARSGFAQQGRHAN